MENSGKQNESASQNNIPLSDSTKQLDVNMQKVDSSSVPSGIEDAIKEMPSKTPARFEIINVDGILQFINSSLNAQKIGVLHGDKAFSTLVDMLQKSIKPM